MEKCDLLVKVAIFIMYDMTGDLYQKRTRSKLIFSYCRSIAISKILYFFQLLIMCNGQNYNFGLRLFFF